MELPTFPFDSAALGMRYTVWSRFPSGSVPTRLCVFLDGEFYLKRMETLKLLAMVQSTESVPEIAAVFVSHLDAAARHDDFACSTEYTRFLTCELVPWAIARSGAVPSRTIITGLSLSGLAAAFAALRQPETFACAICQSPSAWYEDESLARIVERRKFVSGRFWISVGTDETEQGVHHEPTGMYQAVSQLESCQRLADALTKRGAATHFSRFAGGHSFECWEHELAGALKWACAE